jgi:hypothetical protein
MSKFWLIATCLYKILHAQLLTARTAMHHCLPTIANVTDLQIYCQLSVRVLGWAAVVVAGRDSFVPLRR